MAAEYSRLIFNLDSAPSPKFILVAVPLYMYRIQTSKFDSGLNFFEKTVLLRWRIFHGNGSSSVRKERSFHGIQPFTPQGIQ